MRTKHCVCECNIVWLRILKKLCVFRAIAGSEIFGGLVVLGGDNVSPLVEIGLTDLPKTGGAKAPPPAGDGPTQ